MVRFLPLRTVTGLVFAKLFFPHRTHGSARWKLLDLRRRLYCEAGWRGDFRPLRRPHRSQIDADRDAVADGARHLRRGDCADLCEIGVWGAVILTVLRFIQGVGVGGEWGGSVLMSMEWARTDNSRGSSRPGRNSACPAGCSWPTWPCSPSARCPASIPRLGLAHSFVLSIVLVGVGLYIRLGILETPVFAKLLAERKIERTPMLDVITDTKGNPAFGLRAYGRTGAVLYLYRVHLLLRHWHAARLPRFPAHGRAGRFRLSFVSIPLFGHISDRIGRKNMYMIGAAVTGIFGFIYFAMVDTGSEPVIFLAIILSLIPHDMMYGPQAALIAESFTGRLRYSGASLGYHWRPSLPAVRRR